jgi:type I restriction enzyme S subunit
MIERYRKYKDSEIARLDQIPINWESHRIDWITKIVRGNTGFKKDELLNKGEYVALQYGKTYKVDEVDNSFEFFVNSRFYKKNQTVQYGDIILISTSETIDDLGHSCFYKRNDIGLLGGEQILLKPNNKHINEKYLYYYSKFFCLELKKYATGLKVYRFNIDDLKNINVAIPSINEQTQIANYLDTKTAAIDQKISLLQEKIKYYQEYKKTLINETVTKGLDKNVPLKNSGIDWIGKIPEHWEMKRIKELFIERKSRSKKGEGSLLSVSEYYGVAKREDKIKEDQVLVRAKTLEDYKECEVDDIVINIMLAWKKGLGYSKYNGLVSPAYGVFKPNKGVCSKYYHYLFRTDLYSAEFKRNSKGIIESRLRLYPDKFFGVHTIVPDYNEQVAMANYLDGKIQVINQINDNFQQQIVKLQELRKTLINDVVTGKVKVTQT